MCKYFMFGVRTLAFITFKSKFVVASSQAMENSIRPCEPEMKENLR